MTINQTANIRSKHSDTTGATGFSTRVLAVPLFTDPNQINKYREDVEADLVQYIRPDFANFECGRA